VFLLLFLLLSIGLLFGFLSDWSKLKQLLRAAKARSKEALDQAITELLPLITAEDAKAWFRHCINSL